MKIRLFAALIASTLTFASAQTEVVWWDFLGGGDGVRMKAIIDEFNATHDDIQINATTLEWGTPFYTKVQTSAAVGEQPDIMTYHLSRFPLGLEQGVLRPISEAEMNAAGLGLDEYQPGLIEAATYDGNLYGVPLDVHSIILYYNADILEEVGLLGADGKPANLDGIDNFNAALAAVADAGYNPLSISTLQDGGTVYRILYTLLNQRGGSLISEDAVLIDDDTQTVLDTMRGWVANGYANADVDYPSSVALFTEGNTAFHINGVWEVPTMVDLEAGGDFFNWGAIAVPTLFDSPATWADSHVFAIPESAANPISDEKVAAVMEVIAWINKNSLSWASAGHIPAYAPITDSAEYQALEPNATYAVLAENAVFDPRSTIAGVASPLYDAFLNYVEPAINGQLPTDQAVEMMKMELEAQLR